MIDKTLKQERKDLIWLLEEGGRSPSLEDLENFKDDHEIILKATYILPEAISCATDDLKNSRRLIFPLHCFSCCHTKHSSLMDYLVSLN